MSKVKQSITVQAPLDLVYRVWRNFENFPRFMENIEEVREVSHGRSHWKAKGPLGTAPEWDAEITLDEPEKTIGWRSIEGSATKTAGRVDFNGNGTMANTEIDVTIEYEAPAGVLGKTVAKLFLDPERQVQEDLSRFKEMMEGNIKLSGLSSAGADQGREAPLGSSLGATTASGVTAIAKEQSPPHVGQS